METTIKEMKLLISDCIVNICKGYLVEAEGFYGTLEFRLLDTDNICIYLDEVIECENSGSANVDYPMTPDGKVTQLTGTSVGLEIPNYEKSDYVHSSSTNTSLPVSSTDKSFSVLPDLDIPNLQRSILGDETHSDGHAEENLLTSLSFRKPGDFKKEYFDANEESNDVQDPVESLPMSTDNDILNDNLVNGSQLHVPENSSDDVKACVCLVCEKCFTTYDTLEIHMRSHTEKRTYSCLQCDRTFRNNSNLARHSKDCQKGAFKCPKCNKKLTIVEKQTEVLEDIKVFECSKCCVTVSMNTADKKHHRRSLKKEKKQQCSECGEVFQGWAKLSRHVKTQHIGRTFACSYCEKSYFDKRQCDIHMRSHTGEKPYTCNECHKAFSSKQYLKDHIKSHAETKPFACSYCAKEFWQQSQLVVHERTHTGEKPYQCTYCERGFAQKQGCISHMETHKINREKAYGCEVCGKLFFTKYTLNSHMITHSSDKPHKCSFCDLAVATARDLKMHMRTHTGEKPHVCEVCGKMFSRQHSLTIHTRVHTGERPYHCDRCNFRAIKPENLKVHMRTHTGEKPYNCDQCQYKCAEFGNLKKHKKSHEKKTYSVVPEQLTSIDPKGLLDDNWQKPPYTRYLIPGTMTTDNGVRMLEGNPHKMT